MFYKIVKSFVILSVLSSSIFADAATAPAPTNSQLAKRIADLERQVKTANQFIETQKIFNQLINESDTENKNDIIEMKSTIYDPGNLYDMIKQNASDISATQNDVSKLRSTIQSSDGVICRLKQVENYVLKYGTTFHSYEPVCVTY